MKPTQDISSTAFPQIAEYTLTELIYSGSRTAVYRGVMEATRESDQPLPIVVKVLQQEYPSASDLVQFRNQYSITHRLNCPGVVRPIALESWRNGYALVMKDSGAISLQQYAQSRRLTLTQSLSIAVQLAEILHDLDQHQMVHKDIKPANILFHPNSGTVQLIDFSIASVLPKENKSLQSPSALEGTLAYLAPEQTGRMNRGIDYRTDFYALGVTLYELLTGVLPFQTKEPLALVHCHIAQTPTPTHEVNDKIPPIVSAIVQKLMAKNAEDRYQNALGLKHDLETCLHQWKDSADGLAAEERIVPFMLGQQDSCDRFLIPEKLYGREAEVDTLLNTFERVAAGGSELLLVEGFSGIGKTAVVNEVQKPITRQQGYFAKGKFDQFNRNIPFSAFIQAWRDLVSQLLSESDDYLVEWKAALLARIGDNGALLVEAIPELEIILGLQPPVSELSGTAAQNRFYSVFQQFVQTCATPERPLTLFIDDLQWADVSSLQLLQVLMGKDAIAHLFVIGAYRDNEVSAAHPAMLTIAEIAKAAVPVSTLTLSPLVQTDVGELVADTFNTTSIQTQSLTDLIYQKTQGNPFFTTQFLQTLHSDGYITFNAEARHWQCDIAQVRQLTLTDNVVDFMTERLHKFSASTQQALNIAACIGNQFDLNTLAIVLERSAKEVATELEQALATGLICPRNEVYKFFHRTRKETNSNSKSTVKSDSAPAQQQALLKQVTYRFLHDRVQQAAYALKPKTERAACHLNIGRLLLSHLSTAERQQRLFEVVNQLNHGLPLIDNTEEQQSLLQLNLLAGQQASAATAYGTALDYVTIAIGLLGDHGWQQDYETAKTLYTASANNAYLSGEIDRMEAALEIAFNNTRTLLEKVVLYEIKIQALVAQRRPEEALALGFETLKQLGVELPAQPTADDFKQALGQIKAAIADRPVSTLIDLPAMEAPETIAALKILLRLSGVLVMAAPQLLPYAIFKMVNLSIAKGNTALSALGYATCGVILCNGVGDVETGYAFGQLAAEVLAKYSGKAVQAKTVVRLNAGVWHWKEHLQNTLPALVENYQVAIETGDLEYASVTVQVYANHAYFSGQPLAQFDRELTAYTQAIDRSQNQAFVYSIKSCHQSVLNLMGEADDPLVFVGRAYDETVVLPQQYEIKDAHGIALAHLYKGITCYLLGAEAEAFDNLQKVMPVFRAIAPFFPGRALTFYDALCRCALYPQLSAAEQALSLKKIVEDREKLAQWASHVPTNYQHKLLLVEAEELRILGGNPYEIMEKYDLAIASATANDYLHEAAISNERAAYFYLAQKKENVAAGYLQDAYYGYAKWGAQAKSADLEQRYPQLLRPILQAAQSPQAFNPFETIAAMSAPHLLTSTHTPNLNITASKHGGNLNTELDFTTVVRASQSLSSAIELDDLLSQLSQMILRQAGGDRCVLLLSNSQKQWQVRAIATPKSTALVNEPLKGHQNLPTKLIRYVKNTQSVVVVNNLVTDLPILDDYLRQKQPKSLLCLPILNQGQLIGILYLNNLSTSDVFSEDRILILKFLCTQAAISLQNAQLHTQEQEKSRRLQTTLQELKDAQLHVVQGEKMASLGNLVAGVAHEINNPIGFLNGSLDNAEEYLTDLLDHLKTYQQQYPQANDAVEKSAAEIDLDFLKEDFPKLLNSMKGANKRIKSISTSLRTFSRADTEYKVSGNLEEGLDSTLLILKYRLKANEYRPAIEIIKDYGSISEIDCFPGRLNQVFMNLLANAIDVFDEVAQASSYETIETLSQSITVTTAIVPEAELVEICIRDNGKGMSAEVQSQIFNHLYTTKEVGKGTGLGLAIARQIVVEAHGGTLSVQSEPGQGTEFRIRLPIAE